MKNKITQYVVLFMTCIIWGSVAFRVYTAYSGSDQRVSENISFNIPANEAVKDTFSIQCNYRDPFLGKEAGQHKDFSNVKKLPPVIKTVKEELKWPALSYDGLIKNQQTNKLLAILHVNGESTMIEKGEVFKEVTLFKIFKDSIEIIFNKQTKIIRK